MYVLIFVTASNNLIHSCYQCIHFIIDGKLYFVFHLFCYYYSIHYTTLPMHQTIRGFRVACPGFVIIYFREATLDSPGESGAAASTMISGLVGSFRSKVQCPRHAPGIGTGKFIFSSPGRLPRIVWGIGRVVIHCTPKRL